MGEAAQREPPRDSRPGRRWRLAGRPHVTGRREALAGLKEGTAKGKRTVLILGAGALTGENGAGVLAEAMRRAFRDRATYLADAMGGGEDTQ